MEDEEAIEYLEYMIEYYTELKLRIAIIEQIPRSARKDVVRVLDQEIEEYKRELAQYENELEEELNKIVGFSRCEED